jgi:uncharacterized protein YfeS
MDHFEFTPETAHPDAQALMTDDFFWSPIEESGPFGSDDGSDAAYGFRQWRPFNKTASPVTYLDELIREWNYPFFDYREMDTTKIEEYISSRANPDESTIKEQIQTMKEVMKNSPDNSFSTLDDQQLRNLVVASSEEIGGTFLRGQDSAIIGTAFAQFVLEGRIDKDLKSLTTIAIQRQLMPTLINRYDDEYREIRELQLTKMLEVITKASV